MLGLSEREILERMLQVKMSEEDKKIITKVIIENNKRIENEVTSVICRKITDILNEEGINIR